MEKRKKGWRMSCDVGKATELLENELWRRWSDEKVGERALLLTYVSANSSTAPLLDLRHSSFSNPSFAPATSLALQLHHLASRPWERWGFPESLEITQTELVNRGQVSCLVGKGKIKRGGSNLFGWTWGGDLQRNVVQCSYKRNISLRWSTFQYFRHQRHDCLQHRRRGVGSNLALVKFDLTPREGPSDISAMIHTWYCSCNN